MSIAYLGMTLTLQSIRLVQGLPALDTVMTGRPMRHGPGLVVTTRSTPASRRAEAAIPDRARAILEVVGLGPWAAPASDASRAEPMMLLEDIHVPRSGTQALSGVDLLGDRAFVDPGLRGMQKGSRSRASARICQGTGFRGGEKVMLVIARALMSLPRLLLPDEPSLGVVPRLVARVFDIPQPTRGEGVTVLLLERDAAMWLNVAVWAYVLEAARIGRLGTGRELALNADVRRAYLGAD